MALRIFSILFVLFTLMIPKSVSAHTISPNHLQWELSKVGAINAWNMGATGKGISVLVIDTGLDRTEATTILSGSILPSIGIILHEQVTIPCATGPGVGAPYGESCSKTETIKKPTDPYTDSVGHGSFVVSEIAAHGLGYNFWGIAPQAKVAMAKVFYGEQASSEDVATAIRWGVIHKFSIISMSLGGSVDEQVEADAVAFAVKHHVLVVAATGNSSEPSAGFPAGDIGVIAVGASDRWDKIAYYSNGGASIAAPGDYIWGIAPMHPTTINCGGFCLWEGTSMATPLVAGALADLLSMGLTTAQAKEALLKGARRIYHSNTTYYGAGILDLIGSLRYAQQHYWVKH